MITELTATTTERIVSELLAAEGAAGASRVLTLVISTDAEGLEEALAAAHEASRDHPCRIIAVVGPPADQAHHADGHTRAATSGHLDAELRVGHDAGAGETLVLRPWGEAAEHTDTLVVPFLLPDVPVVTWWPCRCPTVPSEDPLGRLATTRITNTPAQADPAAALRALAPVHASGDIDLAWTRITLWCAMVAATLGPLSREGDLTGIVVAGEPRNASVSLMVAWLRLRLGIDVSRVDDVGAQGISSITAATRDGELVIARKDQDRVTITRPGASDPQVVTMARREPISTMNEELRRLTPDLVYVEVLAHLGSATSAAAPAPDKAAALLEAQAAAHPAAEVVVAGTLAQAAAQAAARTAELLAQAVQARGAGHLALTGGSAGVVLAEELPTALEQAGMDRTAREAIHVWFGDERFVPAGHPERNDLALDALVEAGVLEDNIHRVAGPERVENLEAAAEELAEELTRFGPSQGRFDVIHLGLGPDAHVCSLFPGHSAAVSLGATAVAVRQSPKPPPERVSLTMGLVQRARTVMVVAGGQGKVQAVAAGLSAPNMLAAPASCARGAQTVWYLDAAAAAGVP